MGQPCDGSGPVERSPELCGRGDPHSAGFSLAAAQIGKGYNKPANLSFRGRGYRRDTIRYQTQTLGAHPDPKIAAPRAASLNSAA